MLKLYKNKGVNMNNNFHNFFLEELGKEKFANFINNTKNYIDNYPVKGFEWINFNVEMVLIKINPIIPGNFKKNNEILKKFKNIVKKYIELYPNNELIEKYIQIYEVNGDFIYSIDKSDLPLNLAERLEEKKEIYNYLNQKYKEEELEFNTLEELKNFINKNKNILDYSEGLNLNTKNFNKYLKTNFSILKI